jgi:Fungal Zn(2)-Cys(6) binuclear cluster domain
MEVNVSQPPSQPASPAADPVPNDSLPDILRNKRKPRSLQVCQPCRVRKVKCTCETPCQACIERGHPELCQYGYGKPAKRIWGGPAGQSRPNSDHHERSPAMDDDIEAIRDRLAAIESVLGELRDEIRALHAPSQATEPAPVKASSTVPLKPTSAPSETELDAVQVLPAEAALSGNPVYLGGNSVPAMVMALASDNTPDDAVQNILGKSILPIFCLDNESATYPFVDLWGIPHGSFKRVELLCKLLPAADAECIQTFGQYRDTAHVIFPGITNITQFESDLLEFLRSRSSTSLLVRDAALVEQDVYGKDLHWLGLLFAILASGAQCSPLPRKERQMKSQVYGNNTATRATRHRS